MKKAIPFEHYTHPEEDSTGKEEGTPMLSALIIPPVKGGVLRPLPNHQKKLILDSLLCEYPLFVGMFYFFDFGD